jgi:hypothetical protein
MNLDAINPDVLFLNPDLNSYNINTNKNKLNTKVKEKPTHFFDEPDASNFEDESQYLTQVATDENLFNNPSVENMNSFVDPSLLTNFSANTITEPNFLKWLPNMDMSGEAEISYNVNNQDVLLRYHLGDISTLKSAYPNNKYVQGFLKLLKFCFKYNAEDKRIDPHKIERSIYFIKVFKFFTQNQIN